MYHCALTLNTVRNTTMLKAVLLKYSILIEMDDDEMFTMQLKDKINKRTISIRGKQYSVIIRKAYSQLLRDLKNGA